MDGVQAVHHNKAQGLHSHLLVVQFEEVADMTSGVLIKIAPELDLWDMTSD